MENETIEETIEEEVALHFKRFSKEKQDQIRGLVNYATLMGLDGKDLISIGGRLERVKISRDRAHNKALIAGVDARHIGNDSTYQRDTRFKIKTNSGTYHFESRYDDWSITSLATKVKVRHSPEHRDWGRISWNTRRFNDMCLDIATGEFKLNF